MLVELTIRLQGLHLPYPSHLHRVQRENSIRCGHYAFLLRDVIIQTEDEARSI